MIAKEDKSMEAAVVTLRELSGEDEIRLQCEAGERYERDKASYIGMGRDEGRMEESANTEREPARAEEAEAEVLRLRVLLENSVSTY